MIFKDGDVIGTKVGQLSKSQLTAFIDSTIWVEVFAGRKANDVLRLGHY
jgi:hypothetical protein